MIIKLLKRKAVLFMISLICFISTINPVAQASSTTATIPIIRPGYWSLGDTFSLIYGRENFTTYKYTDIQNLYINKCYEKQMNEIFLETNDLQYSQYCLQYDAVCQSIASCKQLIEKYNVLAKSYEDEMINSTGTQKDIAKSNMQQSLLSAQSYEKELATEVLQKVDIYVNRERCLFINNNEQTYRNQQYVSDIAEYRNSIYSLKLLAENHDLQGVNAEYSTLKASEQNIHKSKDMSFQSDVDWYTSEYGYYTNQQELLEQQSDSQYEKLLYNSNILTNKGIVINTEIKSIRGMSLVDYNTYESGCIITDIKKKQLEDKLRIINAKITILKEYFSEGSNEVILAKNEKLQANVELAKWLAERESILKNTYALYKSKYNEIGINEKKAKALYEKYVILQNKYNYGLASKITMKEAELKYMQSSFSEWNSLYEYAKELGNIEKHMSGNIQVGTY